MTILKLCENCGNSPKNQRLQEFVVASARADADRVLGFLAENVTWQHVGRQPVTGVQAVTRALVRLGPAASLQVSHVVSHGRNGAVDGVVAWGNKHRAFCHVIEFGDARGTKVSSIMTYSFALK